MVEKNIDQSRIEQFGSLEFIARQVVEGFITGLHKSPLHGFSVEFAEHRLYNTGESVKHVDWKLFGRTDKLFVKRFEEETNLRCQLVIDNSSSMYYPFNQDVSISKPNKISFSVYAVAAIMYMLRKQRDAVGLSVFAEKLETHTPCKSTLTHHKLIYNKLEELLSPISTELRRKTSAAEALHLIAESIHKRSLIVIFSDMFENTSKTEDMFQALQHLKYNKHEVILFHVTDKSRELDFEFENRPYKFIDVENSKELKINPSEVRENYINSVKSFEKELKTKCGQYKIDFIEADINLGFNQILYPYLKKREKLY
ncbi:MAG: DUF58 domain-containing protein [Bacteroidetes bacterium]|nr:DUF58 domain-containing protein [Bacteroidota bacterium]